MDVNERIDLAVTTLEGELDKYDELVRDKVKKESEYKALRAQKFLFIKTDKNYKTVGERESWVDDQIEKQFFDFKLAEGLLDAHKERVRTLRSTLSALQTLASQGRI